MEREPGAPYAVGSEPVGSFPRRQVLFQDLTSTLCTFALSLAALAVSICLGFARPTARPFFVNDANHWYPFRNETLPYFVLLLVGLVVLTPVIALYEFFVYLERESFFAALNHVLGFISAFAWSSMTTQCIKLYAGSLRPDFGSRCFGNGKFPPAAYSPGVVLSNMECTVADARFLNSGRMSFVSGHTSTAMVFATYFALFLSRRARMLPETRFRWLKINLMYLGALITLLMAIFVGVSRIVDNRHFPADVVGGALVGIGFALGIFMLIESNVRILHDKKYHPLSFNGFERPPVV
jgi:membrane-associated phospholipid phosphatase